MRSTRICNRPELDQAVQRWTGKRDSVFCKFYVYFFGDPPKKALRGFQRVHLEPGASQEVRLELKPRDLSIVTDAGEPVVPEGEFTVSIGGGQPDSGSPSVTQAFRMKNSLILPE